MATALVLVACGSSGSDVQAGGGPGDLDDRTFLSRSVEGHELLAGTQVRLTFSEGRLGAQAGCNHLSAPYRLDGGALDVSGEGMAMTDMGCDPARHAQDEWLAEFLGSSPRADLDGDELVLTSPTATVRLLDREVADPDRALVGTLWQVDTVLTGDAASSVPDAATVTFQLPEPGVFRIAAEGCTSATGSASVDGSMITFGDFNLDAIGCPPPWAEVVEVLRSGEVGYSVEADRLTLEAGSLGFSAREADGPAGPQGPSR